MKIFLTTLLSSISFAAFCQPGTYHMTPVQNLNLQSVNIEVPSKYASAVPGNLKLNVPAGYKIKVFHAGNLSNARFLTWSPDSILHVADVNGKILAMPDANHDGVADTSYVAASSVFAHDMKFYKGSLYAAEKTRILKLNDNNSDGIYESRIVFIDSIGLRAADPTGGHTTRTIVFDEANGKLYVSIGSSCNVCREDHRANIEQFNDDGTGRKIYAKGVRNAVGMTLHPATGKLWATNNGSDWLGNNIPPEWVDIVRENGFYGHPFAFGNQVWYNFQSHSDYQALLPITSTDSQKVETMIHPAALVTAHSALMAIEFANSSFKEPFNKGAFVVSRGSWNRTPYTGFKIFYLHFSNPTDTTADYAADFLTGFLTDSNSGANFGRPVGLALDKRGSLFLSTDLGTKFILNIYPDPATFGQKELKEKEEFAFSLSPNPADKKLMLNFTLAQKEKIDLEIYSMEGKLIRSQSYNDLKTGINQIELAVDDLNSGLYLLKLSSEKLSSQKRLMINR